MSDVTGLDKKGTQDAIFQFAIASEMYSGVGHIIKYLQFNTEPNLDFKGKIISFGIN
jgi:hypothetical protein